MVRNNCFIARRARGGHRGDGRLGLGIGRRAMHNVTFDDGVASADQSSGTFERTFAAAGSYRLPLHHPRPGHERHRHRRRRGAGVGAG